jgi:hypothetical protein
MQMWENKGTLRASPWSAGVLRLEKRVTPLPRVTVGELHRGPIGHGQIPAPYLCLELDILHKAFL